MSDDLTLLFLGAPRTGTTSLFHLLKKHPNIAVSENKELFNRSPYRHAFPNKYINQFNINDETKILLDGTPSAYNFFYKKVSKIKLNKKIIYPIRNPFDRIYSTIKQTIITKYENNIDVIYPPYIKGYLKIDTEILLEYILRMLDSKHIERAFDITDDIFIFRFDEININSIYKFLNIYPLDEKLMKYNSMDVWYNNNEFSDIRNEVDVFWKNNIKKIAKIIINDLYEIKKYVNVEDWIIETKNILSNV